jgi:hypothetical protein
MRYSSKTCVIAAIAVLALNGAAFAAPADYRFEVAQAKSEGSGTTDVSVRLVHVPDGKAVTDAVIFESKADMGPAGMAAMGGKVTPQPVGKDGLYHFETKTGMGGKWALHLAAKVQGETETVSGSVTFDAK